MIKLLDVNQFSTPVQKTTKRKEDINADHIAGKKGNQDGRSNGMKLCFVLNQSTLHYL